MFPCQTQIMNWLYYVVFFYELLLEYLKLKAVKTNLDHLKKSVNLELSVINHKSNTKDTLIVGLNDLQEALNKVEKNTMIFLGESQMKVKRRILIKL